MKPHRITLAALVTVAAVATACSTLQVDTDYDPATDFSRYRTFAVREGAKGASSLVVDRVRTALIATLESKGFQIAERRPDLKVFVHFRTGKETEIRTYGYPGWYGWRWGGGMTTRTVEHIPTGTIVIDLVDAREDRAVWRGIARDRISRGATPEERTKMVNDAMAELLAGFPPNKKSVPRASRRPLSPSGSIPVADS